MYFVVNYTVRTFDSQVISIVYKYPNYFVSVFIVKSILLHDEVDTVIKLNIQNLLDKQNKTRYWLVKHMESNYETINRLCDNKSVALQLETIEKLCNVLECEPSDLFTIKQEEHSKN